MSWKGRKRGKKIGPRPTCYFPDDDLCLWVRLWGLCARAKIYCFPTNSRRVSSCSPVHCPCVDMLLSEAQSSPHYSKSNFTLHPNWVKKQKKIVIELQLKRQDRCWWCAMLGTPLVRQCAGRLEPVRGSSVIGGEGWEQHPGTRATSRQAVNSEWPVSSLQLQECFLTSQSCTRLREM